MKKIISVGIIAAIAYFGSGRLWLGNRVCVAQGLCWNFGTPVQIRERPQERNRERREERPVRDSQ
jgi:hypothetical protein